MSGYVVEKEVRHPLRERMDIELPFAIRADCPHCGALPNRPCLLVNWTHPARSEKARQLDREGKLSTRKTLNDLPEFIKKDLVAYAINNQIEPIKLNEMTTERLFECWCTLNGIIGLSDKLVQVYECIKEVRG